MPRVKIIFYKQSDGAVPLRDWLDKQRPARVKAKCLALIKLLAEYGYELHRPYSDGLRDGIRELRIRVGNENHRLLYFFHGKEAVVLSHGITKEDVVPDIEIQRAIKVKQTYQSNPERHSYYHEV